MNTLQRGIVLAVAQVALLLAVGAKYYIDRARLPRAWVETAGYDPDLPIRGRYIQLQVLLPVDARKVSAEDTAGCGRIELRSGVATAVLGSVMQTTGDRLYQRQACFMRGDEAEPKWRLVQPMAVFLSEHARDPTLDRDAGPLWAEVTLAPGGTLRPIRLGRMIDGRIAPLS